MRTLIVDDDPDLRMLVRMTLAADPRLEVIAEAATATDAIEMVMLDKPELIILDHLIDGRYTGLEAAPLLKAASPNSKIILFTGFDHLRNEVGDVNAADAFLLKTNLPKLVALAQSLLGLGPLP